MRFLKEFKEIKGDASFRKFYRNKKKKSIIIYARKEKNKNLLIYDDIKILCSYMHYNAYAYHTYDIISY